MYSDYSDGKDLYIKLFSEIVKWLLKIGVYMAKAQSGMSAAVLVAIIAGLIIAYVLFLPTDDRRELLGDDSNDGGGGTSSGKTKTIILSESINKIIEPSKSTDERLLPNIYLVESKNAVVLEKINPFSVRNGVFDKKNYVHRLSIDNPMNVDNLLLSFNSPIRKGILTIKLNNEIIYDSKPDKTNVIVELKKSIIREANTIEFSVSSVGYAFWDTNEYSFEEAKITANVLDKSRLDSRNSLELSETEFRNIDSASLKFIPYCGNVKSLGKLDVLVNGDKVYSSVPVCEDPANVPILDSLSAGRNSIDFRTEQGTYSIENIRVSFGTKDVRTLTYYFTLTDEQVDNIIKGKANLNLSIEFVDDDKDKRAEISVNGYLYRIDQDEPIYSEVITRAITENRKSNYIEIKPKSSLKLVALKVLYWK